MEMLLPKEFQTRIKGEYGEFGLEIAQYFSFVVNYLGFEVLDLSNFETALKIISTKEGTSLKNCPKENQKNLFSYVTNTYSEVHSSLIKKAKDLQCTKNEFSRKRLVVVEFTNYVSGSITIFGGHNFYKDSLHSVIRESIKKSFSDIEIAINSCITTEVKRINK
jgi:hypothetical protein